MENDQTTIDDKLPPYITKGENGDYVGIGKVWQYRAEPGYVITWLINDKHWFYAIREEPGYIQNEAIRADLATDVCCLQGAKDSNTPIKIFGDLLPANFGSSLPQLKGYRGMRMRTCKIVTAT